MDSLPERQPSAVFRLREGVVSVAHNARPFGKPTEMPAMLEPNVPSQALVINEIFSSFQGEGRNAGQLCSFVRLGGCNLACSWCDEWPTWDWSRADPKAELHLTPINEVISTLLKRGVKHVVITGGEPLLQQKRLLPLLLALSELEFLVEFETAGTIVPTFHPSLVHQWNVSPKLSHSGNPLRKRINPAALSHFAKIGADFKFVVSYGRDVDEVEEIAHTFHLQPERVWLMPEGTTRERVALSMLFVAQEATRRGFNVTTRLHVLAYDGQRGV